MRRLDRYLISEIFPPLGLGFIVYTFILLLQFLFKAADMMVLRGIGAGCDEGCDHLRIGDGLWRQGAGGPCPWPVA